jgi:5-methyltetrahydrofolate--homocysteine methyltransferase
MKKLLPIIKRHNCYAVALTITDGGMPDNIEERVTLAERIISAAQKADIPIKDIYVDPLVKPVSTEPNQAKYYLKALEILKERGINTIGGLSNVSFGLPNRHLLNAVFLQLAIESGITAAIIDPTNNLTKMALDGKKLPDEVFKVAKKVLLGEDEYAMEYIKAFRSGSLSLNP